MSGWPETLAQLREGNVDARDRVVRLIIGCLQNLGAYDQRESWDDVVQDVLLTLLSRAPREHDDGAVAAWIRRVATHSYIDRVRKEYGRRRVNGEASAGWRRNVALDEAALTDVTASDERVHNELSAAIAGLAPRLRRILERKYALGETDAEGAARLGEALGTYKRLVRQALYELREALMERESKSGPVPSKEA